MVVSLLRPKALRNDSGTVNLACPRSEDRIILVSLRISFGIGASDQPSGGAERGAAPMREMKTDMIARAGRERIVEDRICFTLANA